MERRSIVAIGAVVAVGLGVGGAALFTGDDQPAKPAPRTSATSTASAAPRAAEMFPAVAAGRPATFTKPAEASDFNGDGYRDVVLNRVGPGFLEVLYGGPKGAMPGRHQGIGPSTPGVPGGGTGVGAFASADFDRDGYADLAVNVHGSSSTSSVTIFYGSATGLSSRSVKLTVPGSDSVEGLAAGDFDGVGGMDVVVTGGGDCWIFRGITTKPVTGTEITVTGRSKDKIKRHGVGPADVAAARLPVVADVNGDHRSDLVLVVETPAADFEEGESFWSAELRLGTAKGLSSDAIGFGDDQVTDETGPLTGNVNGDGRDDVIVRGPDTDTIVTFLGTADGLAPGKRVKAPFAAVLAVGDTDGDGETDVAVGDGTASIAILPGGKGGLAPAEARRLDKTTPGMPVAPGNNLRLFGSELSLADLDGDGKAELVIEAPQEKPAAVPVRVPASDRIFILPGSNSGISLKGATAFSGADLK